LPIDCLLGDWAIYTVRLHNLQCDLLRVEDSGVLQVNVRVEQLGPHTLVYYTIEFPEVPQVDCDCFVTCEVLNVQRGIAALADAKIRFPARICFVEYVAALIG